MSELKTATEQGASALDNMDEESRMNIHELGDVRADFRSAILIFPPSPSRLSGPSTGPR